MRLARAVTSTSAVSRNRASLMAEQNTSAKPTLGRLVAPIGEMIPLMTELFSKGKSVAFSPRGTSMRPMLREGRDSVILSRVDRPLKKYDVILYRRADDTYVLHRIVSVEGDTYRCVGDQQFLTESVAHDQVIAVLTAFRRRGRLRKSTASTYRLYVVLWNQSRGLRYFFLRVRRRLKRMLTKKK